MHAAWTAIKKIGGPGECIGPEHEWRIGVDEQCAHAIV
jgi:hypothetical protein